MMNIFRRIFDFYIRSSIHVAFAVYALVRITQHMFAIEGDDATALFAFFGTITGYNFVKYDALVRDTNKNIRTEIKIFAALSFASFAAAGYFFLHLEHITQLVSISVLLLTALYTLPFFPNRRNARNWAGIKIYIVALCWMGVTVVLPVLNADVAFTSDVWLKCIQRFMVVFVLILIFEIIDLAKDDPHLQTVPQQIGIKPTKILGIFLLAVFYFIEFLGSEIDIGLLAVNGVLLIVTGLFLIFANPERSKYYTSFWVEGIPVLWLLLLQMFS